MEDDSGKKQKLVHIILNYERDIQEYVNNWSLKVNKQSQRKKSIAVDSTNTLTDEPGDLN